MKVYVFLKKSNRMVKFNDVLKIERDEENLYLYEGEFVQLYQTTIPLKDIKGYHVERSGMYN